ncbi:hypothetical protein [Miltoncostaea marina]|uniref:hypothetical protein n=1 Tax=Miltoncostaea marina TaxID=2843215 RepID=UPI001C3CE1D7|nr:hypothetical protein [Miltoncostaea marina]
MAGSVEAALAAGAAAAQAGDWPAARDAFAGALDEGGAPAELGLADALLWLGDSEGALERYRRAYRSARSAAQPAVAAEAALGLYFLMRLCFGNAVAARGWLARLERLVDAERLEPFRGWATLARAHDRGEAGDLAGGRALAEEALAIARTGSAVSPPDPDLELCAMSALGALLVDAGRVAEGFALLDEAMAASLAGEGRRLDTAVFASCCMVTACAAAAQFARAAQWIRMAEAFARRSGSFHVHTTCRLSYGCVLVATGRWKDAEEAIGEALRSARAAEPALFAEALARLAELRLAQGRVNEAAGLLAGVEDHPTSAAALAGVLLARGDAAGAAAALRRRLRATGDRCLEAAALVALLAEAETALGDARAAARRARALLALGADAGCEVVVARAELALGRIAAAAGRPAAAAHLERALEAFHRLEMPLEAGRAHLLLADALAAASPEAAIAEARGRRRRSTGSAPPAWPTPPGRSCARWARGRGRRGPAGRTS